MKTYDGQRYRQWAGHTMFVIDSLLSGVEVEQTAYRSCMGILQMSRTRGNDRLEAACRKARYLGNCTYIRHLE
jgi:hypothetical protein